MSNETLPFIDNESEVLFEELDKDCLADVFRIWDCDEKEWHDAYPIVFRFENNDLLLSSVEGSVAITAGIVDTADPESAAREIDGNRCLCWQRDCTWSRFIGRTGVLRLILDNVDDASIHSVP